MGGEQKSRVFARAAFLLAFLAGMAGPSADAAEIGLDTVQPPSGSPINVIFIDGELRPGDEIKFANIAVQVDWAVVILSSPGGDVEAGIEMGNAIRIKRFATWVPDGFSCASACALAWLGGRPRWMGPGSRIGFHAVSKADDLEGRADSVGNAVVGAYLNQLGLPISAIAYITSASPSEIQWLSFEDAERIGIEVKELALGNEATPHQPAPGLRPDVASATWIQIFSRQRLADILQLATERRNFDNLHAYEYDNGWYVLVLGPYPAAEASATLARLKRAGSIPKDSLVVGGARFSRRVWSATEAGAGRVSDLSAKAIDATNRIYAVTSLPNSRFLPSLRDLYAPVVTYYGKPTARADVIADKKRFAERWPVRTYTIVPNTVVARCPSSDKCEVQGLVQWNAASSARRATSEGSARFSLDFSMTPRPLITAESSEVLSRAVNEKR